MEIMELAAELGKKIKEDPRLIELNRAEAAYNSDTELQALIREYNVQSAAISEEYKKEKPDTEFVNAIQERIHKIYESIMANENMNAYTKAQDAVNAFMNEVNGEITYQITGERPCTHDCSTCGGCHH